MKIVSSFVLVLVMISAIAFADNKQTSTEPREGYDVKKGVERVQYEWTKLGDKDRELLKEASDLEKRSDAKVKKELEEYRAKTDELYNNLSDESKKFISQKSKLYKKLSNKARRLLDEMYFLIKKGVSTFQIPGIDELMPLSGVKSSNTGNPQVPVVDGKAVGKKKTEAAQS